MNQEEIINTFKNKANAEKALGMEKYMKNLFPFLGISSPERKLICKELLAKKNLPEKSEAINFSKILWNKKEREFQYVAIDLLDKYKKQLEVDDIVWIEKLIARLTKLTNKIQEVGSVGSTIARDVCRTRNQSIGSIQQCRVCPVR